MIRTGRIASGGLPATGNRPVRALLANAVEITRQASGTSDRAVRNELLMRADRILDRVAIARPVWGEARIAAAYLADQQGDYRHGDALVRESYADAPFLREAAEWRVSRGLARWTALDDWTREHVLREALFVASADPQARRAVFAIARRSPAYAELLARWRTAGAERSTVWR